MRKYPRFCTSSRAREGIEFSECRPRRVRRRLSALAGAGLSGRSAEGVGTETYHHRRPRVKRKEGSGPRGRPKRPPERAGAAGCADCRPRLRGRDVARSCRPPAPPGRGRPHPRGGGLGSPPEGVERGPREGGLLPRTLSFPWRNPAKALPAEGDGAIGATRFAPCHDGTIQPTFRHFSQPPQHP